MTRCDKYEACMNKAMAMFVGGAGLILYSLSRADTKNPDSPLKQSREFQAEIYAPHTDELRELIRAAAPAALVPAEWADRNALHQLLHRESGGWVGIPNYTYGQGNAGRKWGSDISNPKNRHKWHLIHNELRQGVIGAKSTATGIGQHLLGNVKKYYPDGPAGIGDAYNEAVGFLAYIRERYKTPESALNFHYRNSWY